MQEIWKPVKDWENLYEISNYGVIRRIYYDEKKYKHKVELPYYIKPRYDKDGYIRYSLCNGSKMKQVFAHREVAKVFLENPNNYPMINHKDCNRENNFVENLEWCSAKYNVNYCQKLGRLKAPKEEKHYNSKVVEQYDLNGNLIATYNGTGHASRTLGILSSHIRECCRNKMKTYKGYIWKYKEEK